MGNNRNRRPNGTARRLRRIEEKLDIIISGFNHLHTRINGLQARIEFYKESGMDEAITRLHASAHRMKEMADKELQAVRDRYGESGI